jgi:hypothetical protein
MVHNQRMESTKGGPTAQPARKFMFSNIYSISAVIFSQIFHEHNEWKLQ